jgi:predicted Zn finger-like uncharacterized protein
MELNCPQCAAHFAVPDGAIGPKGRKVKCAKCGHTWRQMPAGPGTPAAAEPSAAETMPMEMAPRRGTDAAEPAAKRPVADALPMTSEPPAAADDDFEDPLAGLDFGGGDTDDEDLDGLGAADDGLGNDTDLDDLLAGDPDPIPDMFARGGGDEDDGQRKSGKLAGVLLGLVVLAGVAAAALYFGRTQVVTALPETESVYAALGIPVDALGIGLRFNEVTSERLVRDGTDTLVVRGFIANTSDVARQVPFLRLALFDATNALVQHMVAEPPQPTLDVGATTGFRIQLENPSAAARRFEVDWTRPPVAGGPAEH